MPDQLKPKIDTEKVIAHLKEKWRGRPCPMCETGDFIVGSTVFELREFHGGAVVVGATPLFPVVTVMCKNCGCTLLVNAVISGVLGTHEEGAK